MLRRVERGITPLGGIALEDARAALARIDSLSREQWASAWSAVGEQFLERAEGALACDRASAADHYSRAWRLHHYARWPTEKTPARVLSRARRHRRRGMFGATDAEDLYARIARFRYSIRDTRREFDLQASEVKTRGPEEFRAFIKSEMAT